MKLTHEVLAYFAFVLKCSEQLLNVLIEHHPYTKRILHFDHQRLVKPLLDSLVHLKPGHRAFSTFSERGWVIRIGAWEKDNQVEAFWYPQTLLRPVIKTKKRVKGRLIRARTYLANEKALVQWATIEE